MATAGGNLAVHQLIRRSCVLGGRFGWAIALGVLVGMPGGSPSWAQNAAGRSQSKGQDEVNADKTFDEDVQFLKQHVSTIVLRSPSGQAQVAVTPDYQGRVMTSSATGGEGTSYGWINYELVASGKLAPHINAFGGEERFWLGPEGGQFSIYFAPGAKFEFADWQTPAVIDSEKYEVVQQSNQKASFRKEAKLRNYSNTVFDLRIDRSVELLSDDAAGKSLGCDLAGLDVVGYRTDNKITNTGDDAWTRDTGLLSIWLLGMYKPGPQTTMIIPYHPGPVDKLGPVVNDTYFGKVPAERLKVEEDVMYFSGDGKYRSKIGLTPQRAKDVCGSWDAQRGVLTIVKYTKPGPEVTEYVNSMWELQDKPFAGDTVNAYNDGAPEPGAKPLGPFYELETSSPALALKPGESGSHIQETYHMQGPRDALDQVSQQVLGVSLDEAEAGLK